MERLYIETTVPSYLMARPSYDITAASRQAITQNWWEIHLPKYEVFISNVVIAEAGRGDPAAARKRLEILAGLEILTIDDRCIALANPIFKTVGLPDSARDDCLHIAVAAVWDVDYILTWNFRHIANAHLTRKFREVVSDQGFSLPEICTPDELMGEEGRG